MRLYQLPTGSWVLDRSGPCVWSRSHFDSKHHQHSYNHNYHHHTRHHSASPLMYPSIDSGATSPQPMPSDTAPDAPPRRRLKFLSGLAG